MGFPAPPVRPVRPLEPTAENEDLWIERWDMSDGRTFMEWCTDGGMPIETIRQSSRFPVGLLDMQCGTDSTGAK